MENSIYLGLSRQMALQTNMDIVANNIANMNTAGFRAQNPVFEEYLLNPSHSDDPLSFVNDYGQYQMTDAGPMEHTGNPLNVALVGDGYMSVQMPNGETGYTRDGNFHKSADGTLVTSADLPVLGNGGPINIPDSATEISIDENGVISDQSGSLSQLQIVEFEDVQILEPAGRNLYTSPEQGTQATTTVVSQGYLEGSNVAPVVEMTRMIEVLRNFQATQKLLDNEHERLRGAIQKLTQT